MKLRTLFLSLFLLCCASAGYLAGGIVASYEAEVTPAAEDRVIPKWVAPDLVAADTLEYHAADGAIYSGKPVRVKQIEFSCDSDVPCLAYVRYGSSATAPIGFALQVTAGASRTYDFWRLNQDGQYVRQRGVLLPASFYDEVSGGTHAVFVVDRP